jgi:peptidyl-prolyl cis-trans isomerase B (cyclophilin B)
MHFKSGKVLPLHFLLFLTVHILISCSDVTTSEKVQTNDTLLIAPILEEIDSVTPGAPVFPMLNNENAEAFLLDFLEKNPQRKLLLTTRLGSLKVRLFDDTPLHTANFLMLIQRGYFDGTEFTRVVRDFVVQGGNNDSETEELKRLVIGNYKLREEISSKHIHRKGALAMARQYENNPEKESSAYDFYFVHGRTFNEPQLLAIEREHEMKISPAHRELYYNTGGAPHLDGQHTVFGEIYEGLDVLDKMAAVKTDASNWPDDPLIMEISIIHE